MMIYGPIELKGGFLDLNWSVRLALTSRFA